MAGAAINTDSGRPENIFCPSIRAKATEILLALGLVLIAGCSSGGGREESPQAPPALVSGPLAGKIIVGYQGWFGCPGDADSNQNWYRWFRQFPLPTNLKVDLLPTAHGIDAGDLCETGLLRPDGSTLKVFSAQNPNVVDAHFRWMSEHGIDGAAMQRFVLELDDPQEKARRDRVLENARSAAEANGRVFYLTYDISGEGSNRSEVVSRLRADWIHLVENLRITDSPNYLKHEGKPVLQIWGFGFSDRAGNPAEVLELIGDLKRGEWGLPAVYLIGGVPSRWRTLSDDSKSDSAWSEVYRSYDAISPWSVGRYSNPGEIDAYVRNVVEPDLQETNRLGIAYMPVTFPGFSWRNQMLNNGLSNIAILNQIPRNCGDFLWHQYVRLMEAGATSIYGAMFDEFDEGTALAPAETDLSGIPLGSLMLTLNQEGCDVPDDWYLRVTGKAGDYLKSGTLPPAQLSQAIRP